MKNNGNGDEPADDDGPSDDQAGRKRETLKRLERGKSEALRLIKENDGIYPRNGGRLSQAEICRLAGINPTLLGQPAHKHTTRSELNSWLRSVANEAVKGKRRVRSDVTARISSWKAMYDDVLNSFSIVKLEMLALKNELAARDAEIAALKALLAARDER